MSTLLLRPLRYDPADAEVASHKLLVRAGYIRGAAPGCFFQAAVGIRVGHVTGFQTCALPISLKGFRAPCARSVHPLKARYAAPNCAAAVVPAQRAESLSGRGVFRPASAPCSAS